MVMKIFILLVTSLLFLFTSCFSFANCPKGFKKAKELYFNILVCGDTAVSDYNLQYAANVIKSIIDFNGDNKPDNPKVVKRLFSSHSFFAVVSSKKNEEKYLDFIKSENFTIVYEDEMVTDLSEFDPTLEEALHLITQHGFAKEYPSKFGEFKSSEISILMDIARGGHFEEVPLKYPNNAFYTYYDQTCDYGCQITEFTYWVITSLRNQQSINNRFSEIEHEWQLNTKSKIEKKFPEVLSFFSNPIFGILY